MKNKIKIDTNKDKLFRMAISVILAFFMWAFALSNTDQTESKQFKAIPVTFINTANLTALDLVLDEDDFAVDVTLYGDAVQVSKMKKSDLVAIVDVSSVKSVGKHSLEVSVSGAAQNVSVSDISDKYISVSVSDMKYVQQVVEISRTGTLPEGYAIIGEEIDYKVVEVYGNEKNIAKVASVKAGVNVNSVSQDVKMKSRLVAYDESGQVIGGVTIAPENVEVSITVGKIKEVPLNIITKGEVPDGFVFYDAVSDSDTVKIAAKENVLSSITYVNTAPVDITSKTAPYTISVALESIDSVVFLQDGPVKVNVNIEPEATSELEFAAVEVLNGKEGLKYTISGFTGVKVTFSGDKRVISGLDASMVKVYVDVEKLEEGTHTVGLKFDVPEGVKVKGTTVSQVTVVLSK